VQGDQIGRIFAHWVIFYSGCYFENNRSSPHLWTIFYMVQELCIIILTKIMGRATFWPIFSQTHLVALVKRETEREKEEREREIYRERERKKERKKERERVHCFCISACVHPDF
jgi:hypothetical protein